MSIHFLVPTNFEDYTINALYYCIQLAEKFDAEITLFHAFRPICEETDNTDKEKENIFATSHQANEKIQEIIQNIISKTKHKKVVIHGLVQEGYAEDLIPAFANSYKPEIIVMGTKSKGETIKELLGSITFDIINKIQIPVLAIPKDYDLHIESLKNIMFLTSFTKGEYTSLHKLIQLVIPFNVTLYCIQYFGEGKVKESKKFEDLEVFMNYCLTTYRNQKVQCEFMSGKNIVESTNDFITNKNIDLLVIKNKKRNAFSQLLHPATTKSLLFNLEIPMLFFHQ